MFRLRRWTRRWTPRREQIAVNVCKIRIVLRRERSVRRAIESCPVEDAKAVVRTKIAQAVPSVAHLEACVRQSVIMMRIVRLPDAV